MRRIHLVIGVVSLLALASSAVADAPTRAAAAAAATPGTCPLGCCSLPCPMPCDDGGPMQACPNGASH